MLKSKIHRVTITDANLNYEGSVTLDPVLMRLVDVREHEKVQIVNLNNGARFETYCITGKKPGSGEVCINGAASRLVQIGDIAIIMAFTWISETELESFQPKVIKVNSKNQPLESGAA